MVVVILLVTIILCCYLWKHASICRHCERWSKYDTQEKIKLGPEVTEMMTQPDSCKPDSVAESVLGSEETSSGENLSS